MKNVKKLTVENKWLREAIEGALDNLGIWLDDIAAREILKQALGEEE